MSAKMERREFITLLGGAAATWPLAARAQTKRMRRIGVLMGLVANDPEAQSRVAAFENGLQELGWVKGRNLSIEYRWAGDGNVLRDHAAELLAMAPDLILANSTPVTAALREQSRAVPIVFTQVVDPVGAGFVDSLARPGGNATGFTTFEYSMSGKWVELLKEIAPHDCATPWMAANWPIPGAAVGSRRTAARLTTPRARARIGRERPRSQSRRACEIAIGGRCCKIAQKSDPNHRRRACLAYNLPVPSERLWK